MTESSEHRRRRFEAFHAEHFPAILSYALRRCPTRDDACDLASEVFLTAWRRFDDVPAGDEGRLWLFGAARRSLGNRVRGDQRRERLTAKLVQQVDLLALPDHDDSRDETVLRALAMLSRNDRELLVLTAWDGLTPAEAATVLEISASTARVRLHRAKERLRRRLKAVDGATTTETTTRTSPTFPYCRRKGHDMSDLDTLDSRLRLTNPVSTADVASMSVELSGAIATSIMDSEPRELADSAPLSRFRPHQRSRGQLARRSLAAAVIIGGAAAGFVAAVSSGPGTPDAFATWNPKPTPVTGAAAQAAARQCQTFNNLHGRQHLVVAEKRGIYSFTVLTSRDALSSCLLRYPADGASTGAGGTGDNPNGLVQPSGDQVVTLSRSTQWERGHGSYISVIGRGGPDVVGVDVTLRDRTDVKATLKDSWWTMWPPGGHYPTTITVHDTDGTSRTQKFG